MTMSVRQATIEDIPSLHRFVEKAYGDLSQLMIPVRWNWEFLENPNRRKQEVPVWIVLDGNDIVGQTCTMPIQLSILGDTCSAAWAVDTIVLPQYQGKGVATMLQKACTEANPILMSLSMSPASRRVKEKLGFVALPPASLYRRQLRASPSYVKDYLYEVTKRHDKPHRIVRILCSHFFVHFPISFTLGPWIHLRDAIFRLGEAGLPPENRIEERSEFDGQVDDLWARAAAGFEAIVRRDRQYLNWKFVRQPGLKHKILYLFVSGEFRGYAVLREPDPLELAIGIIAELFTATGDSPAIEALLRASIDYFRGKVSAIEIAASHPDFESAIKKVFGLKKRVVPMFYSSRAELDMETARNAVWFLGKGDQDWDQIYPMTSSARSQPNARRAASR